MLSEAVTKGIWRGNCSFSNIIFIPNFQDDLTKVTKKYRTFV
ncbi:hypothetical protein TFKS16_2674 [Tannerella forsythia KS16]|uniref:Uncharacterized protein n=1 Tax=Tannerella forsythia (strain ATCC 43037 / JCM 10827 / CCUG 21028 A / KCTC 5666 / FDC 338) TaxID=203275 RepID=G8UPB9_TANFA|nr:hypothetical protein BFO_2954 [Tannerella forsythia 92A2]BAR52852.1 hypothetical protein TFKS16_2674 [Tannerella forsythia KS16]